MELYEIIVQSASSALALLDAKKGCMPPGHNGPYYDSETPVRNTSHWLITFIKAYSVSHEKKFFEAAHKLIKYLCSNEARPMAATFWHRKNPKKDTCNGLIGQAWTIEALVVAAIELGIPELVSLAEKVFLLHPFNEKAGLWQCVSADGTYLSFDFTFNHQLWFAAAGSLLANQTKGEVESQIRVFMERLNHNYNVHSSGLIRHFINIELLDWQTKFERQIKEPLFKIKRLTQLCEDRLYLIKKEIGYHSFNLYAFALMRQQYPNHAFWGNNKLKAALSYAGSKEYWQEVQTSKYGYSYNPPGFEAALALEVFFQDQRLQQERWIAKQFCQTYDFGKNMMSRNTQDPITYAARLYEATRLPNLVVDIQTEFV